MACGGGGSSDPSLQHVGEEIGAVLCPRMFECGTTAELQAEWEGFSPPIDSVEDCQMFYATLGNGLLGQRYQASVDSGRTVYHADRMGACLDQMASATCADFGELYAADLTGAGDDPFAGQQAEDAPCAHDKECTSNYCEGASIDQSGNAIDGACAVLPGDGEPCEFNRADGYHCEFGGSGSSCVPTQATGAECWGDDTCASNNCEGNDNTNPGMCSASYTCDGA